MGEYLNIVIKRKREDNEKDDCTTVQRLKGDARNFSTGELTVLTQGPQHGFQGTVNAKIS